MAGQLEQIISFISVAEQGGFAAAGRMLGLSPSIVTRQIAELEANLGVQLFTRTTRHVALTDAGRLYLERTLPILSALKEANTAVVERQIGLSGPLTITAPLSFGMRVLPQIMSQFRIMHPNVSVNLQLTDRFVDIARDGYDMALRISGPPTDQSTIWRKICVVPRIIAASPDYLARRGTPAAPKVLQDHDCLHYAERGGNAVLTLARGEDTVQVALKPCLTCNNGDTLVRLVCNDEGIVLLPAFLMQDALDAGALQQILPDWNAPEIWLTVTYPNYEILPAKVAAFTALVEAEMSSEI
ncbi:LysR family transcriptional regulator [Sulfitobacter sp. SK012]|uniref:LysR family transcriptional regulator n=1 Tax=Sulfitobacter sp. SK012 TaxID=1389005 RepID=UPI000E0BDEB2|nr:LysR family transcriptional regulator [Sulfitobacter sp. SK012]AXI45204.1 LysR family transcriptional regulator [Sulfitobacter sp. SK012]